MQIGVPLEGIFGQFEKPRAHDAALIPEVRQARQVVIEIRCLEEFKSLRVRLHDAVFDAIVDHFGKMSCAGGSYEGTSVGWCERLEGRLDHGIGVGLTARHQAVADLQSPDATRCADIEVSQAAFTAVRVAPHRIGPA